MTARLAEARDHRVLLLAPTRKDASTTESLLQRAGIAVILGSAGVRPEVVSGNNMALAVAQHLGTVLGAPGKWIFLIRR